MGEGGVQSRRGEISLWEVQGSACVVIGGKAEKTAQGWCSGRLDAEKTRGISPDGFCSQSDEGALVRS